MDSKSPAPGAASHRGRKNPHPCCQARVPKAPSNCAFCRLGSVARAH